MSDQVGNHWAWSHAKAELRDLAYIVSCGPQMLTDEILHTCPRCFCLTAVGQYEVGDVGPWRVDFLR